MALRMTSIHLGQESKITVRGHFLSARVSEICFSCLLQLHDPWRSLLTKPQCDLILPGIESAFVAGEISHELPGKGKRG